MKRRKFIKRTAAAGTAFSIVPSFVLGGNHIAPSDTLYVASIGVGGRGANHVSELSKSKHVKFVAFCDVDDRRASETYKNFPDIPKFKDFRKLYDAHIKDIDAITVGTPDHLHATIALPFMKAKKHAYVEKPLAHNIAEARLMTKTAEEEGIVTQMGNQGTSSDGIRETREMIEAGLIGKVTKVDCWTNRPVWPQGMRQITEGEPVPDGLDWNLWLGPAEYRPYNSAYLPFKWRGWWDFGTGALGDMGCHIMDTPFTALQLGYPTEAEASCTTVWAGDFVEADYSEACPPSSVVRLKFEKENNHTIELNWYDGGLMPDYPENIQPGETIGNWDGGSVFYGDKGILVADCYSGNPRILGKAPGTYAKPAPTYPRIEGGSSGHFTNFIDACINGSPSSSPFKLAGKLTEGVLMGNLALKAYQYKVLQDGKKATDWAPYEYPGRQKLLWDGEKMEILNYPKANEWVHGNYRDGWKLT